MRIKKAWFLGIVAAALFCCLLGVGFAESQTGTLTVAVGHDRLGEDAGGFEVSIYRIGRLSNAWSLDSAFAETGVLQAESSEEMEAALEEASGIVDRIGTPAAGRDTTGADGLIVISGLETGVYFGRMAPRDGYSMTPFFFTVPMNEGGKLTYDIGVNPKLSYESAGSITLRAFKEMKGRELKAGEFTFSLRTAGNRVIQRVRNNVNGNVVFSALNYRLNGDQLMTEMVGPNGAVLYTNTQRIQGRLNNYAIRYLIAEDAGEDSDITYDDNVYTVEVRLTDNGRGAIAVQDNQGRNARIFRNAVASKEPHKLTIYYKYLFTGETAFPTYTETLWEGDPYNVPSPDLPGYYCTLLVVTGVMPDHDMEYTVYYFPLKAGQRLINIDDLETPLGLGDIQIHVGVCYE